MFYLIQRSLSAIVLSDSFIYRLKTHFQFILSMSLGVPSINYFRIMVLSGNLSFEITLHRFFLGLPICTKGILCTGK